MHRHFTACLLPLDRKGILSAWNMCSFSVFVMRCSCTMINHHLLSVIIWNIECNWIEPGYGCDEDLSSWTFCSCNPSWGANIWNFHVRVRNILDVHHGTLALNRPLINCISKCVVLAECLTVCFNVLGTRQTVSVCFTCCLKPKVYDLCFSP